MPDSNAPDRLCQSCERPLRDGSTFCIACGCHNDADQLAAREFAVNEKARKRLERASVFGGLFRTLRFLHIFRFFR